MNNPVNKNTVIIIADSPIVNPLEIKSYQNLSVSYSIYLNTLLLSNWIELFSYFNELFDIITFLHKEDEDFLPKFFSPDSSKNFYYSGENHSQFADYLLKNSDGITSKTLILYYNSIGLTKENILRIFSLIQTDEPSIVIGKSAKDKIVFLCSNRIQQDLLIPLLNSQRKFSKFLNHISKEDIYIHQMDNLLSIDDFEDIKKLYIELSKKESLSFCSKKMQENFNDLFIEYKDLLNV